MTNRLEPTSGPVRRVVVVGNPQGLHIRPAAAFAEVASRFTARVVVIRDDQTVDGKFWPDLLMLAAEQGTPLTLECDGSDAAEALEALASQLAAVFEDEPQPSN